MRESIESYFQVGTILWMSYPPALYGNTMEGYEASLRKILSDDFFQCIELTRIPDEAMRERAKGLLAQSHMKVCYGTQPILLSAGLNPNCTEEAGRKQAEEALIAGIEEAAYLGAEAVAFLAGKWQEETKEEAYESLRKTTVAICRHAAARGMAVNLEVFDYDCDKAALIGPAPLAARFAADVRLQCPNFGLLADLSHFPLTRETSRFVIQTLRPYITHLHIGNAVVTPGCPAYGDKHPRFGYPQGANDTRELLDFFRILREEGFFRREDPMGLSLEVTPQPGEDPDLILANTKRVIRRAWALLEE